MSRGHWPAGRRRNAQSAAQLARTLDQLRAVLATPVYGRVSLRACARACGVSPATVHRWLKGEDWPRAGMVQNIKTWMKGLERRTQTPSAIE